MQQREYSVVFIPTELTLERPSGHFDRSLQLTNLLHAHYLMFAQIYKILSF